jgi:hypothetical protein
MGFENFKGYTRWGSQFGGAAFLIIWSYLQGTYVFVDTYYASKLVMLSFIAYLITIVLGLLSLPRWQGFVALAICAYATYWFTTPPYAIGCN